MKKLSLVLNMAVWLALSNLDAQIDKTFWFAVPHISPNTRDAWADPAFFRISTFNKKAKVTISQPALSGTPLLNQHEIPANSSYSWNVTSLLSSLQCQGEDQISSRGLLITSDELISVYYDSGPGDCNPDMFSLKGTNGIGHEFIITAGNFDTYWDTRHEAYVIATEDNTTININPSVDIQNHLKSAGNYTKTLNKGEVYIISSVKAPDWMGSGNSGKKGSLPGGKFVLSTQKLCGTIVTSNKPISVVHADDLISPPYGACGGDLNGDHWATST